MDRIPKEILLQRRHTNGKKKTHGKILSIINQIDSNPNNNEVSPHANQNGQHKKKSTKNKC